MSNPPPPVPQPGPTGPTGPRRLLRTPDDRWVSGVCGGWARYLGIDPTLVRVLAVLAFVLTGFFPMGVLYLVAWAVTPRA